MSLEDQLEAMRDLVSLAPEFLDHTWVETSKNLLNLAEQRVDFTSEQTVVGLLGPTGAGKSSLFNALVGTEVATVGVLRPTTSQITSATWGEEPNERLLDWFGVKHRCQVEADEPGGLILLDLPDFDSVAKEHRQLSERLAGTVDVLLWVTDPQKYADRRWHQDFVAKLTHQGAITAVAVNQTDLLSDEDLRKVLTSLEALLADDGLDTPRVFPVSALTGSGIGALEDYLKHLAIEKRAATQRWGAEVSHHASQMLPDSSGLRPISNSSEAALIKDVCAAIGEPQLTRAARNGYFYRSRKKTGWLPLSWLRSLRPDPLKRLGLPSSRKFRQPQEDAPPNTLVTSARLSPAWSASGISSSVGRFVADAGSTLPEAWRPALWNRQEHLERDLQSSLDQELATGIHVPEPRWWWGVGRLIQWVALVVLLVGAGWYGAVWAAGALRLPAVPLPEVSGWPIPFLLIAGALLGGLLAALIFAAFGRLGAYLHARRVRRYTRKQVAQVVKRQVLQPVEQIMLRAARMRQSLVSAAKR